ncbi:MFS transporter [Candidatus Desantisbacteria bacterium CG_4_10_14_0_8_um_filter_48_22]|uniref:MFS transporter n=1 Tax=Candidatus Desantisbacteria bacterium CG_4_10_14_0_8_um_filter_48_22 TaxID=1974543 RepID=A0A2M7SE47_9BACT|nr:MAG: hypothetical protein AUJ67_02450 [Candidatus Desantisbacteria bacterium CG1_02_49_89]PIV57430.1 MAG: MFS transporter [Candidatus Desantisbacteria bacterium CG02_land_8_20_14_3_00_49_13]PIZ17788.1 MAG: MFS transporter [Candidatus Desantisbacteria bacterium CG_4_10_14_0_8_um_filter_48_22]PJB27541.1 MAG: MFS transporter [Candidatus Desantisbacteria bacterium CG_4_9_14_3_um_filter_50_7]
MDENKKELNKNIKLLGWTSFSEDVSSQMNYSILPLFLANILGVNKAFIGLVEGIAETTASFLKVFFGWLSDRLKKRKIFVVAGYSIGAFSKPFLSIAVKGWHVLGLRFLDRIGKGTRTSPRDALIADSCEERTRGKAFGFHRSMDTAGAVVGPLLAFLFLYFCKFSYRNIFLISVIPAVLAVVLVLFTREQKPQFSPSAEPAAKGQHKEKDLSLSSDLKKFLFVIVIFTLGNSSDAFLILRAGSTGINAAFVPLLWVAFNLAYALSAFPAGVLSDRIGSKRVITCGFLIYAIVYAGFAFVSSAWLTWLLFIIYGFYYGLTDGVSRAFVSKLVPPEQRATAFGMYHSTVGFLALPSSLIMGMLWDRMGPRIAFLFGSAMAISAVVFFILFKFKVKEG